MTDRARIVLKRAGMKSLLTSAEMYADMLRRAENVNNAAGEGYAVDADIGANRARASVRTDSFEAMVREAREHRLISSLGAARV